MLWHATFLPKHQDGIMHMLRLNENRLIAVAIIRQALKKTTCRVMMTIQAERKGTAIEHRIPARL